MHEERTPRNATKETENMKQQEQNQQIRERQDEEHRPATGSFLEVLAVFTRLGLTSFGGPIAHLGYFREEIVVRPARMMKTAALLLAGSLALAACASSGNSRPSALVLSMSENQSAHPTAP